MIVNLAELAVRLGVEVPTETVAHRLQDAVDDEGQKIFGQRRGLAERLDGLEQRPLGLQDGGDPVDQLHQVHCWQVTASDCRHWNGSPAQRGPGCAYAERTPFFFAVQVAI